MSPRPSKQLPANDDSPPVLSPVGGEGRSGPDRIELMGTFVQIAAAGSLSAAAMLLNTTQPTVSRRLQALEKLLGVRLVHRSTHSLRLTEEGERCLQQGKALIEGWQALQEDLGNAEPTGTLRVLVPHALGQDILVKPLAAYVAASPKINVEWILSDRAPDFVATGIDCAIQVGEVSEPNLVAIKISEIARIAVASPSLLAAGVPETLEELAQLPWLALGTYYRKSIRLTNTATRETKKVAIQPRMVTDSLYALHTAASLGLGACVASAWLVDSEIAAGRLVHLLPAWEAETLPVHITYPFATAYPPRLRSFVQAVRGEWG
jgi:DNA-binding transcriptional LysR family regulator